MENYLVLNGKKVELTKEQIEKLGLKENRKTPFDRTVGKSYYYSNGVCVSEMHVDSKSTLDNILFDNVDYFNDKEFANQVNLHQLLYSKLLRYAYENGAEDKGEWNGKNYHCYICKSVSIERPEFYRVGFHKSENIRI